MLKEIFSNRGVGTMVYANEHDNMRPATRADIPEMLRIMQRPTRQGIILPRTAEQIDRALEDFVVYEVDGTLHGCAALHRLGGTQAEVAALVVDNAYAGLGTGRKIVTFLLEKARAAGMGRVFVLTTQASDWFVKLGFRAARPADLPKQRREAYDRKRGSRVLACRLRRRGTTRRLAVE
jgi:amino-acid N-acetyltransferase